MRALLSSEIFLLALTIGAYLAASALYKKTGWKLLHPLLVSACVIIVFLCLAGIDYGTYREATSIIDLMLGMSVVALGYLLYDNMSQVKGKLFSILASVTAGSVVGVISVALIAKWMGAGEDIMLSLQPKSTTTPIALSISANSGGIESLTSLVVVFTGIFGSITGPFVLKLLGIKDRVAKGLALGAASHAVGTATAIKIGAVEGAAGGLAIGLMGVITALLIPVIELILY